MFRSNSIIRLLTNWTVVNGRPIHLNGMALHLLILMVGLLEQVMEYIMFQLLKPDMVEKFQHLDLAVEHVTGLIFMHIKVLN